MELVLVRHARPVRVEEAEGPADPPLTPEGIEQADATARWLAAEEVHAVYSSPMRRAVETATPLAEAHGHELQISEDIREYDAGNNSYIPYEELKAAKDEHWRALAEDRLGDLLEGAAEFRPRVAKAMEEIILAHPGQRVVVVCHGGTINVFLAEVLGLDRDLWFEPGYASIHRVVASRQGVRSVASVNETGHLVADGRRADAP